MSDIEKKANYACPLEQAETMIDELKDDLKRQKLSFTKQNTELSKLTDKFEERLARQERRDGDQDEIMRKLEQAIEINEKNVMKSKQNAAANSNIRK